MDRMDRHLRNKLKITKYLNLYESDVYRVIFKITVTSNGTILNLIILQLFEFIFMIVTKSILHFKI